MPGNWFGRLGSFSVALSSAGADMEAAFSSSVIKSVKVRFTAGKKLAVALKAATFKKRSD
ncbi:hypothetical protein [Bifidobacterium sp.]|uniref:HU family DNA-binding protein n=1 Tax=Bifidobacterium sp. TaxID=41200 RepID=UPI0039ED8BD7